MIVKDEEEKQLRRVVGRPRQCGSGSNTTHEALFGFGLFPLPNFPLDRQGTCLLVCVHHMPIENLDEPQNISVYWKPYQAYKL